VPSTTFGAELEENEIEGVLLQVDDVSGDDREEDDLEYELSPSLKEGLVLKPPSVVIACAVVIAALVGYDSSLMLDLRQEILRPIPVSDSSFMTISLTLTPWTCLCSICLVSRVQAGVRWLSIAAMDRIQFAMVWAQKR